MLASSGTAHRIAVRRCGALPLPVYYTISDELPGMSKKRRRKQSRVLPVRVTARSDSSIALEVDGVVQSVSIPTTDDDHMHESGEMTGNPPGSSEPGLGPDGGY